MPPERKLVLLVDDDNLLRQSYAEVLEADGFRVAHAENGRVALDYCLNHAVPSLLVVDIDMPKMNGWELLAVLRCYHRLSGIPIVIVSGTEVDESVRAVYHFEQKPLMPAMLVALARKLT